MRILLVRHGQSAANKDKLLHKTLADHAIPLSELGQNQAFRAGKFLGDYLQKHAYKKSYIYNLGNAPPENIRVWLSPYERTRETASGIFNGINSIEQNESVNLNFDRRENIRLCEQQFGLFDGIPDNERYKEYPAEAAHYEKCENQEGHFWARMPLGESRFDVANRVYQIFGTLHRDSEKHDIHTVIVVCHGVTLRAFAMEWLHLSPEWFNDEPNPGNCDIRLIQDGNDHGYIYRGK